MERSSDRLSSATSRWRGNPIELEIAGVQVRFTAVLAYITDAATIAQFRTRVLEADLVSFS
jgi:hypothetical protein